MSEEEALHIRVAEALGYKPAWTHSEWEHWRAQVPEHNDGRGVCVRCPGCGLGGYLGDLPVNSPCPSPFAPRYDTDWSATGPLIERYQIGFYRDEDHRIWIAQPTWEMSEKDLNYASHFPGETPLIAACRLILAIAAAGKLETRG